MTTTGMVFTAAVVLCCIICSKLSGKLGVPALLLFIALGMLFGSDGLLKIPFDDYGFAEQVCSFSLVFIMFYGGFGTNWRTAKPVVGKAVCLSTLGVVLTAAFVALFCHFCLRFGVLESFLTGAVISSTDAASVFSILRSKSLNLRDGTASLLEVESGSNDPASYMLTVTVVSIMQGEAGGVLSMVVKQVVYGVALGLFIAWAALMVLKKFEFPTEGFDTIFVFTVALLSYALPTLAGGNGYLAAYLCGIILGNSRIRNKRSLVHFFDGITGLAQIVIFFLLGLLSFPSRIPAALPAAVAVMLFLTLAARPLAVFMILTPMRCPVRQQLLVSWAGLRGAASIVFAIFATVGGVPMENDLFHIVFCISLLSVAVQGTLLPFMARRFGMVDAKNSVLKTFNDYEEQAEIRFVQTKIPDGHPWAGKTIGGLNLVVDTLIVMIKRGEEVLLPKGDTAIKAGDVLVMSGKVYQGGDGDPVLREVEVEKGHKWAHRELQEIAFPAQTLVIMIKKPDGSMRIPNGKTVVEPEDVLVLAARSP